MYRTFCYYQALKGYFYQSWKRITLAEWLSVTIPRTQSTNSARLSMLSQNVPASHCPLNMTSGMAWTTKGIDNLNPTTIRATIPSFVQISFLVYSYILSWLILWRFLQIHFIYHQNTVTRKGAFFMNCFLIFLTHQHHLVELYSAMAKNALENFQVITCSLCAEYYRLPCSLRKFLWVKVESRLEWPNNF